MVIPSTNAVDPRPVLYAGRFLDDVEKSTVPENCVVLGEWDVLPAPLSDAAEGASVIVVLDILSFPFEALAGGGRDVPLVLVLPGDRDAEFISAVFGELVFWHLGFFDRIATEDDELWLTLRRRFSWAEGQRVVVGGGDPASVLGALEGGDARSGKAAHRVEEAALLPRFAAARGLNAEVPMEVLQVGAGEGRWATGFDLATTRFSGVDEGGEDVALASRNFPEGSFRKLGPELLIPHDDEAFDLTFSAGSLGGYPTPEKGILLAEMWRVTRPGGRLLFLEDFVAGEVAAPYTVSVNAFVETLLAATAGQVVLEHVESVRYPDEDTVRGGVLALSRLGVPKRW